MNLHLEYQNKIFYLLKKLEKKKEIKIPKNINNKSLSVEYPPKNQKAHISYNAAMVLAKFNKKPPQQLAEIIKKNLLLNFSEFESIEIAGPGFINIYFKMSFWKKFLLNVIKTKSKYGSFNQSKKKYNIEFVSANPTGPLHVGHCRGAIIGDTLSNLLTFNGNKVIKEYYVNDHGGQIENFVSSVYFRILEIINKKPFPDNKDLYPGSYIIDIAKKIINKKSIKDFKNYNKIYKKLTSESIKFSMELIKNNLALIGVKHDNFVYESKIISKNNVNNVIQKLIKNKYIYKGKLNPPKGEEKPNWESRNQLLFKSSMFGDDIDRPLQKANGEWTYFAGDMTYHANKISRKFNFLINVLGADHAGYTKRITSATKAISNNKVDLICKVSQLVKLFQDGHPFKMSKRKGDYITVEDLVKEVGRDSTRFMMLNRSNDVELDFDFKKVSEKSKDNPVFYVQYAFARISSIFRILKLNIKNKIEIDNSFSVNSIEIEILKKISEWPKCVEISTNKFEPHRIPFYLYELSTLFHYYWSMGKDNEEYRIINESGKAKVNKLLILQAISVVIQNGMKILGVSTPNKM